MKKRITILIITTLLMVASLALIPFSKTNYDLTNYLPTDSQTLTGLQKLASEFGNHTSIQLQVDDVTPTDVLTLKSNLLQITDVEQVIWLDDYVDLNVTPIAYIPADVLSQFYLDQDALLTIIIGHGNYDLEVDQTIDDIKTVANNFTYALRGEAINNMENRIIANHEVFKIILIIVPILIVILFLASSSWFEPVLILVTLAVAVTINYGSNFFIRNVSFITKTMALALQLALSIDYALFLTHRYREEREHTLDPHVAIKQAFKKTFPAITASALTTIAGFLSMMFMQYKIGLDIGIVLSKGILLSYLATLAVLPVLLVWSDKLIEKSKHKTLIKAPKWYITVMNKLKYPLMFVLLGAIAVGFIFQQKTDFQYGNNTHFDEQSTVYKDLEKMDNQFGVWNQIVILIPQYQGQNEQLLALDLISLEHVTNVQSLYTIVDPMTPVSLIPDALKTQFIGNHYARMIVTVDIQNEDNTLYELSDTMTETVDTYFDDYYIVGSPQATTEIKEVVTNDAWLITSLSIIAILVILAITFKSILIPILLVGIIQAAIWLNVSILYFTHISTLYIGYLVVMAIQLGATIDYAVLLTNRYLQNRLQMTSVDALHKAFTRASVTIFISALILSVAGFIEGIFSDISAIKEIGFLLGKGALISVFFVYIFLPPALLVLDKILLKTQFSLHHKAQEKPTINDEKEPLN